MPELMEQTDIQHKRLSELKKALDRNMFVHVRRTLHQMPACDIALLLESSPLAGRKVLWSLIDPDQQGEVLEELDEDVMGSILQLMDPEMLAAATEGMDTDDLTSVLRILPGDVYHEVLEQMEPSDKLRVEAAMTYPEDTAGSLMNTDTITVRSDVSIDVVLRYLRLRGELPEGTDDLYVIDEAGKLLGDMPLSVLLTAPTVEFVGDLMDDTQDAILVEMEAPDIAKLFERYDWISAPVVDKDNKLLGRITIDDVVDIIREEGEHAIMGMAGLDEDEDTFSPVFKSTKRRTLWLSINLVTALIAASISSMFESTLEQLATLAVLMTIVPSMGGIAGSQTLTLVIRGMALGHIGETNTRWLVLKELGVGVLNGMLWATLVAVVVSLWQWDTTLGFIIAGAMFINLSMAGLAGVLIPLAMKRLNIDPALAGGTVLTTVTDVVGLFAFLGMATLVYR